MAVEKPQVFIIADYDSGDPAFVEVHQYISSLIPNAKIEKISVAPFSTVQTGFWAYQLAINHDELKGLVRDGMAKTYLFLNTAPRKDQAGPRKDNAGEGLAYAKLNNGIEIVGVLSGESFSFVKPLIAELRSVNVPNYGSQFRSRDIFPLALKDIVRGDLSCLGNRINIESVPDRMPGKIAHVDGYGNIKLSTARSEAGLEAGDTVRITIGKRSIEMTYTDGIFGVQDGQLCLASGSSGPKGDEFLEISKRSGNAWKDFAKPKMESLVTVDRLHQPVRLRS